MVSCNGIVNVILTIALSPNFKPSKISIDNTPFHFRPYLVCHSVWSNVALAHECMGGVSCAYVVVRSQGRGCVPVGPNRPSTGSVSLKISIDTIPVQAISGLSQCVE